MIIAMRLPVTSRRRCVQITAFGASDVPDVKINAQIESRSGSRPGSVAPACGASAAVSGDPERGGHVVGIGEPVRGHDRRQVVGDGRQQVLVPRFGEHQPAVRVDRVTEQVFVAARVVEADDRAADERGASEREEVVGRVVEEHRDVAGRAGRKSLEEERGEPARLVEVLGMGPLPVAELDRDAVSELARVAPQQRGRVLGDERRLPGRGNRRHDAREPVELAGVELGDAARFVVGDVDQRVGQHLAAVRPVRVVVREVGLPHDLVDTDQVAVPDRVPVGDHADPDVLREHLRRRPVFCRPS